MASKQDFAPSTADTWREEGPDTAPSLHLAEDFPIPSWDDWKVLAEKDLKGEPFDKKLLWKTLEGLTVQPLYDASNSGDAPHKGSLPGFAPFVRGNWPLSGVAPSWQIRQDCVLPAPEDVNGAIRDGLARGEKAIAFRLDNAARQGFDGDQPEARDFAGRGGCTVSSINGLRIALADLDLERYPVTIRTGTSALPVLAMLLALAEERGIPKNALVGSVECDPVRDLLKNGHSRAPFELLFREMADMVAYCASRSPGIRPIMVNSHPVHNAGATATQELGMTLATGAEYLRALVARGVTPDTAGLSMIFSFSVSSNLFMEVAKLRAARMLWAKIVKAFGAKMDDSMKMFLHARTSTITKSAYDPYNNLIRSTVEAFAAVVGGCDSLYVAPFDENIGRPDDFSMRLARNQQLILMEEGYLTKVCDAAAGSHYLESLTDQLARAAWAEFQAIEAAGGMLASVKAGSIQKSLSESAGKRRALARQRRLSVVGVNNYANPSETPHPSRRVPREEFLAERRRRLARLKAVRHNSRVRELLGTLTTAAHTPSVNTLEAAVAAAGAGATIGEILAALAAGAEGAIVYADAIRPQRLAYEYEKLREAVDKWRAANGGAPPRAFLVPFGAAAMRRARVGFAQGFVTAGGLLPVEPPAFKDPAEAAAACAADGAKVFVLCSEDPAYLDFAKAFCPALKAAAKGAYVVVAGYPDDAVTALREAGVDDFLHVRSDVVETLERFLRAAGIDA
ncbi:MAG: methylmalonyl-CoA mutase family protein [Candidatus Sumerlaeia bacterium]|nr:methylmalonyl-CoA mutase family protein [Candidatus Sumerlaeia bacterium]